MGQGVVAAHILRRTSPLSSPTHQGLAMVKAMKAGGKSMSKSDIAKAIEGKSGVKAKEVKAVMEPLEGIIPGALKASGKFTIPGVTMIKLRKKPATPAGKRMAFGKEIKVKAKPARTIVKCFTAKSLKDSF